MNGPLFYSKILLFGEYGIIKDSKGLSIPYNFYNGALKLDAHDTVGTNRSRENIKRFATYLKVYRLRVRFSIHLPVHLELVKH